MLDHDYGRITSIRQVGRGVFAKGLRASRVLGVSSQTKPINNGKNKQSKLKMSNARSFAPISGQLISD